MKNKLLILPLLSALLLTTIPAFTLAATDCSTVTPNSLNTGKECGTDCEYKSDLSTGKMICAAKGSATPGAYDVNVSTGTVVNNGECTTVGYPIESKDAKCDGTVIDCPTGSNSGWRCIPNTILKQEEIPGKRIAPYTTKIEIPCNTKIAGGSCPKADNPAGYVARLYQFGLMIVGFVALGAMIYGAAKYTLSAGNFADKEDAKDQLLQAVYGILLLLGAYLILYTINPTLINLTNPTIEPINLDDLLPPEVFISEKTTSGNGNSPSENAGGTIDGCEIMSTGSVVDFGVGVSVNGQEAGSATTGGGTLKCTKCFTGRTLNSQGNCDCAVNTTDQGTGVCCANNSVAVGNSCNSCDTYKSMAAEQIPSDFSQDQITRIKKYCPGVTLASSCNGMLVQKSGLSLGKECVTCSNLLQIKSAAEIPKAWAWSQSDILLARKTCPGVKF